MAATTNNDVGHGIANWTRIGNYDVAVEHEQFRIFPRNQRGETIPVVIHRNWIYCRCTRTGNLTTFKRYLHRKQWHWSDSRRPKGKQSVPEYHVQSELSRMLFRNDGKLAMDLMACAVLSLPIGHLAAN